MFFQQKPDKYEVPVTSSRNIERKIGEGSEFKSFHPFNTNPLKGCILMT